LTDSASSETRKVLYLFSPILTLYSSAPPAKLEREASANTQLRRAICEAKEGAARKAAKRKPDAVFARCHPGVTVYEDYACMLNQTNIGQNNNKFYLIQIGTDTKEFVCFTRWGRVGEAGQWNVEFTKKAEDAIKIFEKKFKDKTKNNWADRDNFEPVPKKYTLLEMDDDSDEEEDAVDSSAVKEEAAPYEGPCNLHPRTMLMIKLIFSDDMFVNQMADMSLDVKKMPLGKLSKLQIAKGLEALIDIEDAIKKKKVQERSSLLPPSPPPPSLPPSLPPPPKKQKKKSQPSSRFASHDDIKHRKLLWHGTNVAVVAAILKAGLRIMPHSGGLVGRGIYFASEHAKSSFYVGCHYGAFEGESYLGFMFLVEVALGKESSITQSDGSLTEAPSGYDSVVARGRTEPDPKKNKKLVFDGKNVTVPLGKPVPQKEWSESGFGQSEYLVYKESQARIRYILKFSFI
ncbi:protein mono-ADP-ribosyltransferase PARP3-like, partial [Penaeus chinensis]|uniref:protein mono-ADP-ribosyltransferase PARP3-like n=1 Tax=Penaeus chinensis TaxID=139456 RepID=UPI001FB7F50C